MQKAQVTARVGLGPARRRLPPWKPVVTFSRRYPVGAVSGIVLLLLVAVAIFAPLLVPHDPNEQFNNARLVSPGREFLLGTDQFARDNLSRVIMGSRVSLRVGILAVTFGTVLGSLIGLASGFLGGKLDLISQRAMDVLLAFPSLVLAMTISAMLGPGINNAAMAVSIGLIPGACRVVRGCTVSIRENLYVLAAQALGSSPERIMLKHILPNVTAPIIVIATTTLGTAIIVEASLSFLGLGVQPPDPSWGSMLSGGGRRYFLTSPWMALAPGTAITLVVMSFNLFGDAMRDAWDPRLRGR